MKIYKIFSGAVWRRGRMWGGIWFCVFGYGLLIATAPPLLSIERNGYKKRFRKFDMKFRFLRPEKQIPLMVEIIYTKEDHAIAIIVNKLRKPCVWLNRLSGHIQRTLGIKTEIFFYGRNETDFLCHLL